MPRHVAVESATCARDRMGHIRPEATVESVVGVRAHPDTVSQMASNHSCQRLQLASPLGGHPGSTFGA